jgi:hypothetical protein
VADIFPRLVAIAGCLCSIAENFKKRFDQPLGVEGALRTLNAMKTRYGIGHDKTDRCRRLPPTTVDGSRVSFPPVAREWSCGEFRPSIRKLLFKRRRNQAASDGTG